MPRSFANYLTVVGGQPFLGRLRVLAVQPFSSDFPIVPLVDFTRFGQFVNSSVQTRTEGTIRPSMSVEATLASHGSGSGDNGHWIQFWSEDFVPQTDFAGFIRPTFGRDFQGSSFHGPGFLPREWYQAAWGWGSPTTG